MQIPCSPDYTFAMFLGNPADVREWNMQGLPSDAFSTENGVIVTKSNRLVDSHDMCHMLCLAKYTEVD